jgi:hypothetical protein
MVTRYILSNAVRGARVFLATEINRFIAEGAEGGAEGAEVLA